MSTSIFIEGLKLPLKIGCSKEEREVFQNINLDIYVSVKEPKKNSLSGLKFSSLDETVCYDSLRKELLTLSSSGSFELLEELSEKISNIVFDKYSNAKNIKITASKNIYSDCNQAGVIFFKERA